LPFKVKHVPIKSNPWDNDIETMVFFLSMLLQKYNLVLFAAGPLGNILTSILWKLNNKITYLDIGSTLNPWLVGNDRGYLKSPSNKTCIW